MQRSSFGKSFFLCQVSVTLPIIDAPWERLVVSKRAPQLKNNDRRSEKMPYNVKTYYRKEELPPLPDVSFFHYTSSFDWYGNMPSHTPLMLVAFEEEKPIAALFAVIVRINRLFRGKLFKRCFISQQPAFFEKRRPPIELFEALISHLVKEVQRKTFLICYQNIGDAIFGYKGFRDNQFHSVKWLNIRNSLQRKRNIRNQLSRTRKNQVNKAKRKGVTIEVLSSEEKLPEIYRLIQDTNRKKVRRRFPPYPYFENFYHHYILQGRGKLLLTRYQDKIIGGAILGLENKRSAYCLYYWGKSKRYKLLYPTVFTLFSAMETAGKEGFQYFDYMDVGFLNRHTGKSRFLLQFGGKQKATRRWYRINWQLLNFFAGKILD